jgi:hypothetical protein
VYVTKRRISVLLKHSIDFSGNQSANGRTAERTADYTIDPTHSREQKWAAIFIRRMMGACARLCLIVHP